MESSLISTEKLKKRGYIHGNVEDSLLRTIIIRVQDTIVEPVIGTPLFKRLIAGIIADDLTGDEIALMDNYIVPVMVAGCDYRSVNPITYEIRNKAVGTTRDEHLQPVNTWENQTIKDELKGDVTFYIARLIGYLKDNYDLYPEYELCTDNFEDLKPANTQIQSNISII
jgi:hypothetical protein